MRVLFVVAGIVFFQLLCVGATFSTLEPFNTELGGSEAMLGLLWLALSAPRGLLAPLWGGLSDRLGRKPIMIIGCLATIAGSVCWGMADSWWILFASRLLDSTFSAQAPVATAIIADATPPEKRSAGMGLIGAAVGLAFAIGPLLGIVSETIGLRNMGYLFAGLQFVSLSLILFALPETRPEPDPAKLPPLIPLLHTETRRRALRHPAALPLLVAAFVMTAGLAHFFSVYPLATRDWYGWGVRQSAMGFAILGFVGIVVQGGLVRSLVPRFGERRLLMIGLPLTALGFLLIAFHPSIMYLYVGPATIALGSGLAVPCLQGWLSQTVGARDQGLLLGLSQTAQTMGRGFGPFVGTLVYPVAVAAPFLLAAFLVLAAAVVIVKIRA